MRVNGTQEEQRKYEMKEKIAHENWARGRMNCRERKADLPRKEERIPSKINRAVLSRRHGRVALHFAVMPR